MHELQQFVYEQDSSTFVCFFPGVCGNVSKEGPGLRSQRCGPQEGRAETGHALLCWLPSSRTCLPCLLLSWLRITKNGLDLSPDSKPPFLMPMPHSTPISKPKACSGGYKAVAFSPLISPERTLIIGRRRRIQLKLRYFPQGHKLYFLTEKPMTPDDHWGSPAGFSKAPEAPHPSPLPSLSTYARTPGGKNNVKR